MSQTYCVGLQPAVVQFWSQVDPGKTLRAQALQDDDPQPYGQVGGQVSDIEIQAKDIIATRELLNEMLAKHTVSLWSESLRILSVTITSQLWKPKPMGWWMKCLNVR